MSLAQSRLVAEVHAYADGVEVQAPPAALLRQARRADASQRRTRPAWQPALLAVTCVAAVLALVVGSLGAFLAGGGGSSEVAGGSGSVRAAAIPDRLEAPSPWLPVDETPGRAAVVMAGERKTLLGSSREGVVIVSATTGAYTWLPLPALAEQATSPSSDPSAYALSPDGRLLAWWREVDDDQAYPTTSLLIRDLETGAERRADLPGETSTSSYLAWQDDATLAYATVNWSPTGPGVSGRGSVGMSLRAVTWPGMAVQGPQTEAPGLPISAVAGTPAGPAVVDGFMRIADLDQGDLASDAGSPPGWVPVPRGVRPDSVVVGGEDGAFPQVIGIGRGNTLRILPWLGPVAREDRVQPAASSTDVLEDEILEILGPTGPTSWAVLAVSGSGERSEGTQDRLVWDVDVRRQVGRTIMDGPGLDLASESPDVLHEPSYASDLWAVPTVTRPAPADPVSPRLLAAAGAVGLAAAVVVGFLALRRRRRA